MNYSSSFILGELAAWEAYLRDMVELDIKPNVAIFCREHSLKESTFRGWLCTNVRSNTKSAVEEWVESELWRGNMLTTRHIFDYIEECRPDIFVGKKYVNKRMISYRILCRMKTKIEGYEEICSNLSKVVRKVTKKKSKVTRKKTQKEDQEPVMSMEVERFSSEIYGDGIRAKSDIKKGAYIIEFVGELISGEEFERKEKKKRDVYVMQAGRDCYIDPEKKGNIARFTNHSCDPNAFAELRRINGMPRIFIRAVKDISKRSEITIDYGSSYRFSKCMCRCCEH